MALAFRYAEAATVRFAPETKLFYNDNSIEDPDRREKGALDGACLARAGRAA
jgi:hypothetical protein